MAGWFLGIRWSLFVSVLVHICLLIVAYNQFAKPPSTSVREFAGSTIEIELVETIPAAQSSSSPKAKEQSPPKPHSRRKSHRMASTVSERQSERVSVNSKVQYAPLARSLNLALKQLPVDEGIVSSRGYTLRNNRSSVISRSEKAASEKKRVQQRLDDWTTGAFAIRRVENGAVDTYYLNMKKAMNEHLAKSVKNKPASDFFGKRFGNNLIAIIKIRQDFKGKLISALLMQSSGNKLFDEHIVNVAPQALEKLAPLKLAGAFSTEANKISVWVFEGQISYSKSIKEINWKKNGWAVAALLPISLLKGIPFDETSGDVYVTDIKSPRILIKSRLLKVY